MAGFYTFLLIAFLGTTSGRLLRIGTAFYTLNQGWTFLALLASTFALGRIISSFLGGELTKRFGSRVAGLGMLTLGLVGIAYSYLPPIYYLALRIVHGISAGLAWPSLQALTMSRAKREFRGRASSLYFTATNLGWFLAFLLGGLIPKGSMLPSSIILITLGSILLLVKQELVKERKRTKGKVFIPPLSAIVLGSIALGFMTLLVNTEVAVAIFGREFGRVMGGTLLALAALIGSASGYYLNKVLIDVNESHLSMLIPPLVTTSSSFLIYFQPLSPLGLFLTKAFVSWWRSVMLALARVKDVGRRVGAFNAGGDAGRFLGSLIASFGPWTLPFLSLSSLALALTAWALSLRGAKLAGALEVRGEGPRNPKAGGSNSNVGEV